MDEQGELIWLYYRGRTKRVIRGPVTGTDYACDPNTFIQAAKSDVPVLLRMPRSRCCGRLFLRRNPR